MAENVNVTQTTRGFGGLGVVYLVVQVTLFLMWVVPGWPLNGAAWGLIFLPTFIYFGLIAVAFVLFLGLLALIAVAASKD